MTATLDATTFAALQVDAEALGLVRLGAASLDDPGFEPARAELRAHLRAGMHGEMQFMARSAAVRLDPGQMLAGAKSVLVAAVPYGGEASPVARYAQWADYHTVIHRRLESLAQRLRARCPEAQTLVCVDTKPLLERSAAVLAGIGFLGKNGCLISKGLGSYLVLGCLLTTARVPDREAQPPGLDPGTNTYDPCGECRACLDACPTQAFVAPGKLDPRRCISYLTIEHRGPVADDLADQMGARVAGCDVCQEVCPHNQSTHRSERVPAGAFLPPVDDARDRRPNLVRLATIGNNQHRGFVRGTALNRIPRPALRRNALLALGNLEGPIAPEEDQALRDVEAGTDAGLAGLAARVRRRRGSGAT